MGPHGILSYFTRHATAANLFLIIMVIAGVVAFPKMRAQFFPDVVVDAITVSVTWDGAGPEDVDRGIVQVIEPALLAVEGVTKSSAWSFEGGANIRLEFEPGWDMTDAADDAQAAADSVSFQLPADAEEPVVRRGRWRDRVTDVVISGPVGIDQLGLFADEFVTRAFAKGVTRITIRGVASPSTIVEVTSLSLIKNNLNMRTIAAAIAQEARADPVGDIGGDTRIRTGVEKRSATEISAIVLRSNPDGSALRIGDVAQVIEQGIDRNRAYFVGDAPALSLQVDRSPAGDAIAIQAVIEDVAAELEQIMPTGVTAQLIRTRSEAISARLETLKDNGIKGLGLVLLLLFLFLNFRTAFWVAAGIPAAMAAAIALMYLAGISINMVSLFALIITLGIVVDDAIVVGEHADFRARHLGESPVVAAENAARRMFTPVFSATITTVIAFSGLLVIEGRFGDLIADIPFTVIVVLIASLAECFLILPNHMSHAVTNSTRVPWYDRPSWVVNLGLDWFKRNIFRPFIRFVIWARYPVFAAALLALASQAALFMSGEVRFRFFNAPERASITGNFAMAPGATRADTLAQMAYLQETVEQVAAEYEAEHGLNPVSFAMAEIGGNSGRGLAGVDNKDADQLGSIAVELIDPDQRSYSSFAFVADLQDAVRRHPRVEVISFRGWRQGPGGDGLSVEFYGANSEVLKAASESLKNALVKFPEVSAVEDSLAYDKQELILELTPQGQALGLTIDGLGAELRARLGGLEAARFPFGPRTATIRVELPPSELTPDFLDRMQIRTASGSYVPLADVLTVQTRTGFATVRRENGLQVLTVSGDLSEDDPDRATLITTELRDVILPDIAERHQVSFQQSGLAEQEDRFLSDAMTALLLCLTGIFLTLAWIFSSWSRPIVVMAVIPFGLIGTILGHYWHGVPLSLFSIVGMIGMVGIIINDSIVLVTTIDEYAKDRGLKQAIIDGAVDRLRPVMLTTLTTVLGLAPLLNEASTQAQFLKPTVITLVWGLGVGMFLVLLVVPALMAMQLDIGSRITSTRRAVFDRSRARGPVMPVIAAIIGASGLAMVTLIPGLFQGELPAFWGFTSARVSELAVGLFVAGLAGILMVIYLISAIAMARKGAR